MQSISTASLLMLSSLFIHLNACQLPFDIKYHTKLTTPDIACYMGVDIGGTNSNFGIFQVEANTPTLLYSLHVLTKKITDFNSAIAEILAHAKNTHNITIANICIGAPGATKKESNHSAVRGLFEINSKDLRQYHGFKKVLVVNGFSIIPYGINLIRPESIVPLYTTESKTHGICAFIGAGTGLGTAIAQWDSGLNQYVALPSEGGATEFSPSNQLEYALAEHLRHLMGLTTIKWTHFVSGNGLMRIYSMLKLRNEYEDTLHLDEHDPAVIFKYPQDPLCNATIRLYFTLYARFARNYALTTLPYGGLYIAGGIAAKNAPFFSSFFMNEYNNIQEERIKKILDRIPVFIIQDYNVSLYGAVQYLLRMCANT